MKKMIIGLAVLISMFSCIENKKTVIIPTGISINKTTIELTVGDCETLTARVLPEDAEDKTVTWTSDDPEIAVIDENGKITAVFEGEVEVNALTVNGKIVSCLVTVLKKEFHVPDLMVGTWKNGVDLYIIYKKTDDIYKEGDNLYELFKKNDDGTEVSDEDAKIAASKWASEFKSYYSYQVSEDNSVVWNVPATDSNGSDIIVPIPGIIYEGDADNSYIIESDLKGVSGLDANKEQTLDFVEGIVNVKTSLSDNFFVVISYPIIK